MNSDSTLSGGQLARLTRVTGAWLFARRGESLSVERRSETTLDVRVRAETDVLRTYTFAGEPELQDFLVRLEEHLLEAGWTFQRFESDEDRRTVVQRRRSRA